jgi:multicomponent Na+:H+ antiporter subunit D
MAGGAAELLAGSGSLLRSRLAGLRQSTPVLALLFFLAAISIAGIPPFSGFIGKLALLQGALAAGHWQIAATSLLVSFLALLTALRLWQKSFWGTPIVDMTTMPVTASNRSRATVHRWLTLAPIALLVAHSLAIGLFSERVFAWSTYAAAQILDRESYVNAVAPTDQIEYEGASHD